MYRYADSEAFPSPYNLLAVVSALVGAGGQLGVVLADLAELRRLSVDRLQSLSRELAQIDLLSAAVAGATETAAEHCQGLRAPFELAQRLQDLTQREAASARGAVEARRCSHRHKVDDGIQQAISRVRRLIAEFLMIDDIPIVDVEFRLQDVDGPRVLVARCELVGGAEVDYELDTFSEADVAGRWSLSRLAGAERVTIAAKPRRFRRGSAVVRRRLTDYQLIGAEINARHAEIRLARRDEKIEAYIPRRQGDKQPLLHSSIEGERPLSSDDAAVFSSLADNLYAALTPLLSERRRVIRARIGTEDALSETGATELIDSFASYLEPIIAQVSRRSASRRELQLLESQADGDHTLRVAKDELISLLPPVGSPVRRSLERLAIFPPDSAAPRLRRHETADTTLPTRRPMEGQA